MGFKLFSSLPSRSDQQTLSGVVLSEIAISGRSLGGPPIQKGKIQRLSSVFDTSDITGTYQFGTSFQSTPTVVVSLDGTNSNEFSGIVSTRSVSTNDFSYKISNISSDSLGQTIDSSGNVGLYTSLQVVGGNPAMSYYDVTNVDLKFIRALDSTGGSWGAGQTIDGTGGVFVGLYTSLQVVGGNPAVSYYDATNGDLKFIRALDSTGGTWGEGQQIDTSPDVGQYTSLQIVDGNPAVSYYDFTNKDLKFIRALDSTGGSWGVGQTIDSSSADLGQWTSLQVVGGNPAVSYWDQANRDLKFIRALDSTGGSWGVGRTIDGTGGINVGEYTSLQVVGGNPAISYLDSTNGDLKFIRALDSTGGSWGVGQTIDAQGFVGSWTSLQIVDGVPAISYVDTTTSARTLKFIRALDSTGGRWGVSETIGSVAGFGSTSLQVVGGRAAVSYLDGANGDLKFIRDNPINIDFNYIAV